MIRSVTLWCAGFMSQIDVFISSRCLFDVHILVVVIGISYGGLAHAIHVTAGGVFEERSQSYYFNSLYRTGTPIPIHMQILKQLGAIVICQDLNHDFLNFPIHLALPSARNQRRNAA